MPISLPAAGCGSLNDSALPGFRFQRGGWTYVHMEGSPAQIGFQHGRLLSAEILDMVGVLKVETAHATRRDWDFYRDAARKQLWPHIDAEYSRNWRASPKASSRPE